MKGLSALSTSISLQAGEFTPNLAAGTIRLRLPAYNIGVLRHSRGYAAHASYAR